LNNKRRGNRKELLVKNQYEKEGWIVVKSGASLSPFDLICINPITKEMHVLQIKTGLANTLKYAVKREEEAYKQYEDGDYNVKFKFIKLHRWERYTIN